MFKCDLYAIFEGKAPCCLALLRWLVLLGHSRHANNEQRWNQRFGKQSVKTVTGTQGRNRLSCPATNALIVIRAHNGIRKILSNHA